MYENSPVKKAEIQIQEAQKRVEEIDKTLVYLDQILDAIQPRFEAGKIRIVFRKDRGVMLPSIIKMQGRGKRPTKVKAGHSTRNVKVTRNFREVAAQVKLVCRAAEDLMETRRNINAIAGRLTSAIIGQQSRHTKLMKITLASLGALRGMSIEPMAVSTFLEQSEQGLEAPLSQLDEDWIYDSLETGYHFDGLSIYDENRLPTPELREIVSEIFALDKKTTPDL